MARPVSDTVFDGSIPKLYDTYLVPLIFEPYARDLAHRVKSASPTSVLEIAAGTGVVTRAMVDALGAGISITATDLNQAMLNYGASVRDDSNVTRQHADAMALPFADETFDAVVCQFAAMFFPDRARAYSEARRVLKPGGQLYFNVWDSIEENEFAHVVTESMAKLFPDDPPIFLARTPHGYSNVQEIAADVKNGGFTAAPQIDTVTARSRAANPSIPGVAYCQGTPLRNEIEARNAALLERATEMATAAIARRFGAGAVDGKIQGHVIVVRR